MLLGSGLPRCGAGFPRRRLLTALLVAGLVVANNPSTLQRRRHGQRLPQPARLPSSHWRRSSTSTPPTRAHGSSPSPATTSPPSAGVTPSTRRSPRFLDRHFVTHEQQIMGSIATADTLYAMDGPIQTAPPTERPGPHGPPDEGRRPPGRVRPAPTSTTASPSPSSSPPSSADAARPGGPARRSARRGPNVSIISTLNEQDLACPPTRAGPRPFVTYTVQTPALSAGESDTGRDGGGGRCHRADNLAGAGCSTPTRHLLRRHAGRHRRPARAAGRRRAPRLVLTDTNRKQAFRWDTLTANAGYTETPPRTRPRPTRATARSTSSPGAAITPQVLASSWAPSVTASSYGNSVSYTPRTGLHRHRRRLRHRLGDRHLRARPRGPVVAVRSPPRSPPTTSPSPSRTGDRPRWITRVTLTFDGKDPITSNSSLLPGPSGQAVSFPARTFHTLGHHRRHHQRPCHRRPQRPRSASPRWRPGPAGPPGRPMPTRSLARWARPRRRPPDPRHDPPAPRPSRPQRPRDDHHPPVHPAHRPHLHLRGQATLSALIPDDEVDRLVGRRDRPRRSCAYSSGRLPATSAPPRPPSTATRRRPGSPALGARPSGSTLQLRPGPPPTLTRLDLQVVADGRHSVPTAMTITSGVRCKRSSLPPIADGTVPGAVATVPVSFPP